ncbi:MAG: DUF2127 domain-containing protein [Leptospirillum sp.]|jgi:uncharacterized membrane protein (DUF2068 family)
MLIKSSSPLFLKYIIAERVAKGSLVLALGIGGLSLVPLDLSSLVQKVGMTLHIEVDSPWLDYLIHASGRINPVALKVASFLIVCYGVLNYIVAWGLHRRFRWAEYMTIIEISALIPFEVYAIDQKFSLFRLAAFCVNILIVWYLLKNRSLFHSMSKDAEPILPPSV